MIKESASKILRKGRGTGSELGQTENAVAVVNQAKAWSFSYVILMLQYYWWSL
jgi:hypothetical protein